MFFIIYLMAILSGYAQLQCISPELYQQEVMKLTQNTIDTRVIYSNEPLHEFICELAQRSPEIMENVPDFNERIMITYHGDIPSAIEPGICLDETRLIPECYLLDITRGTLLLFSQQELEALIARALYKCTEKKPSMLFNITVIGLSSAGCIIGKSLPEECRPALIAFSLMGVASVLSIGEKRYRKQRDDFAATLVSYEHLIGAYKKLQDNRPTLKKWYGERILYCQERLTVSSPNDAIITIRDAWNGGDSKKND